MSLSQKELLEMAIYQEISTRNFYSQIAERIQDKSGKKKFLELSQEEENHQNILNGWYERKFGQKFIPDPQALKPVFEFPQEAVFSQSTALEAVSVGIQLERDSANFYSSWKEKEEGEEARDLLQKLIDFENSHFLRLKEEYQAISQNFYWI